MIKKMKLFKKKPPFKKGRKKNEKYRLLRLEAAPQPHSIGIGLFN